MKKVVVIGGGIAGLTAAFRLKQAGIEVTLLEKNERLGGAIHSVKENGFLVEIGPNTILETSPKVTELIRDAGLEKEKVYANDQAKNRYIVRNKKPISLPISPRAFFVTSLFSWKAKLRLLKEPFIDPWDNSYEESLSQFVVRRLGQEFLDYAINPFVAGVYAGDPDTLSVKHGFPKLYALEQTYGSLIKGQIKGAKERKLQGETSKQSAKMFSFTSGLKMIPDRFEQILGSAVHKRARVENMVSGEKGWEVHFRNAKEQEKLITADAVLFAGRTTDLPELKLNYTLQDDFKCLGKIYHPPVSVLALGFKRDDVGHPLDGFGVLIPKIEGFEILGALFSSTLFENRAPEDQVLLTVFIGGTRQPENALKSESELVDIVLKDLKVIVNEIGKPTFTYHVFWEKAIPQYEVGYTQYKDSLDNLERDYPGLFFAGNYRSGISVADTIVNATNIAEQIQAFINKV